MADIAIRLACADYARLAPLMIGDVCKIAGASFEAPSGRASG